MPLDLELNHTFQARYCFQFTCPSGRPTTQMEKNSLNERLLPDAQWTEEDSQIKESTTKYNGSLVSLLRTKPVALLLLVSGLIASLLANVIFSIHAWRSPHSDFDGLYLSNSSSYGTC